MLSHIPGSIAAGNAAAGALALGTLAGIYSKKCHPDPVRAHQGRLLAQVLELLQLLLAYAPLPMLSLIATYLPIHGVYSSSLTLAHSFSTTYLHIFIKKPVSNITPRYRTLRKKLL